ncbi:HAD-IB family phosphatase [candidate division KSB1 bacterium]|jgi:2,3-diketo-5-methylthio-1-phosphopentane phosphatase|nr:HAD-IB family phosphatase [candidate division KSB1 bacterium]
MSRLRIFCDFDGTVAQNDVGNQVFTRFGDPEKWWQLVQEWRAGNLHGREMWRRQAAISTMTRQQLDEFSADQEIDPHFKEFVEFCKVNHLPVSVLSDGMDAYIERILAFNEIDIPVRANHLIIHEDGSLAVEFPYFKHSCGQCANCKGYHLRSLRQPGETIVYVGDGYSDLCAVPEADLVFAKDDLLTHCRDNRLDCVPFATFKQVKNHLASLLNTP